MKKWYRIFEIVNGSPTISDDRISNWFDTLEDAENVLGVMIESYYQGSRKYTILPVYEEKEKG
jgi:hypothetical protein